MCAGILRAAPRCLVRHLRGFAAGWRAVQPFLLALFLVGGSRLGKNHQVRALPARVRGRMPASCTQATAVARCAAHCVAPCSLQPEEHYFSPRSSLVSGPDSAQFWAAGHRWHTPKGWQHLRAVLRWRQGCVQTGSARFAWSWGPGTFFRAFLLLRQRDACRAGFSLCVGTLWPRARAQNRGIAAVCWGDVLGGVCRRERGVCVLWPSGVC
jgi:hypothetical protein